MQDKRTIHIKGVGHAAQVPDTVVLTMTLTARNAEYSAAMKIGSQQIEMLREAIGDVGFDSDDLKTTNFDVQAIYEDEEIREGSSKRYRQILSGFECRHDLKLTFDFDDDKLNAAVDTIANCLSEPRISVAFTVKDTNSFTDKILADAARDALRKAKIFCAAANVKLGKLISVNYPCEDVDVRREVCFKNQAVLGVSTDTAFDFRPDDVTATDSADFVWEIE